MRRVPLAIIWTRKTVANVEHQQENEQQRMQRAYMQAMITNAHETDDLPNAVSYAI